MGVGSKLGIHFIGSPSAYTDLMFHANMQTVKLLWESEMDFDLLAPRIPIRVYRLSDDLDFRTIAPGTLWERIPSKLKGRGIYFEGPNEPALNSPAEAQQFDAWWSEFCDIAHGFDEKVLAYSFSTGNPNLNYVQYLYRSAFKADLFGLHEYVHPGAAGPDWSQIGRYQQFLAALPPDCRKQVVISECGCDVHGSGEDGWRGPTWHLTPTQYLQMLNQLDDLYCADPWVLGAQIFQIGSGDWWSFDIGSIMKPLTTQIYNRGGGFLPPMPTPGYPRDTGGPTDPHLAHFPRPERDNGRALHFILDPSVENVDGFAPWLDRLGCRWTTVYAGDELQATRVAKTLLTRYGIYSNMRVYANGERPKVPDFWRAFAARCVSENIPPYIQIFNEPEDGREGWGDIELYRRKWVERAIAVRTGGGFPGLQALSEEYILPVIRSVPDDVKNNMYFALHNYGANHPPAYPYNIGKTVFEDDTAALRFIAYAELFRKEWGWVPPFIGGEGGWLYRNQDDKTLPPVTADLWKPWHLEMYNWFRTGVLSNGQALPDYLFSVCPWLLNASNWISDSWVGGLDPELKQPLLDALEAEAKNSPYRRVWTGGIPPPPPPGEPVVEFTATPLTLGLNEDCTVHWHTANIQALYFQNEPVTGDESRVLRWDAPGVYTLTLHVVFRPDHVPAEQNYLINVTVQGAPPPTDPVLDPELAAAGIRIGHTDGSDYVWERIWFQPADALPVPNNEEPESRNVPKIEIIVTDATGAHNLDDVLVVMSTSETDVAATTTIDGRADFNMDTAGWTFDPKLKQGPGRIRIGSGGCEAWGFGNPEARHVRYVLRAKKK